MPFELREFEYMAATADSVLLRVAASWSDAPQECKLIAPSDDGGESTLEPLPQPQSDDLWRAAYPADGDVVRARAAHFALLAPDGTRIDLPQPSERSIGQPP